MTAEVAAALTSQVLAGAAVAVVVLLVVAGDVIGRVVTITHEGGHMAIALLTGGSPKHFHLNADDDGAATAFNRPLGWGQRHSHDVRRLRRTPARRAGWRAAAEGGEGVAGFTAYVGLYGAPTLQAAFATGLVLLLLLGGLRDSVLHPHKARGSDASYLAKSTLIPAVLWKGAHIAVAALCVWKAVEMLLA